MAETQSVKNAEQAAKDKLIVALDVENAAQAREIIAGIGEAVGAYKIGLQLFTAAGAKFVEETVGKGYKVFLDVKFHDIPNTVAKAAVEVARLGVWMFNIHAVGGTEMMRRTKESVGEFCEKTGNSAPKIIAVTVLTSINQKDLAESGVTGKIDEQVVNLSKLTAASELDGVVASPREIEIVRQNVERRNFMIVTPGIRPKFATNDDQKRVMTPREAISLGADYLVIGRPVTQSVDKPAAVEKIVKEIGSK